MNDHRDDGRSRDQSDLSHTEQNRNEHQQKYPVHQEEFLNATQSLDPLVLVKKFQVAKNLMQLPLQPKSYCQLVGT